MTIALITGASRGLGQNMAQSLAQSGHDLILTYLSNAKRAEAVADEARALGVRAATLRLDVSDSAGFPEFFAEVEHLLHSEFDQNGFDYLVNNAGSGVFTPFAETSEADFDAMMKIHLKSTFFLTQGALPLLREGGGVVNISSGLARFSYPGYAVYAAMKGGVEVLTRYQARELGPRGLRVNVLAPGAIETDFGGGAVRDTPELNTALARQTALGRVGLPTDIGGVVAFLCSDAAAWITGTRIEASGGMFL